MPYLRLCRDAHRLDDLVEWLLKSGRADAARCEAARAEDYELVELADLLVRRQHAEIAEQLDVAKAAEPNDPREAAQLYLGAAERIIRQRARAEYRDACQYLVRARKVYRGRGDEAEWQRYIENVRERTKPLGVFREELARARM